AGSGAHARLPLADAEDRETLLRSGVTHILAVHSNAKPVLEGMTYLCISASDSSSQNLMQHFKECIKFIHECRLRGGGCLVHCLAGVSRSTTVLVAYLMTVTELSWEGCLAATRAVRSYVSPNCGFQQQLQEYEATLLTEVGPARLRASTNLSVKPSLWVQTSLLWVQNAIALGARAFCLAGLALPRGTCRFPPSPSLCARGFGM
uniref:Dual specificity protein phosphatase 15 n=1 Tax=Dromaius novaehollandiae TaxID=8790 RepID=A0A8C4JCB5_DRONO